MRRRKSWLIVVGLAILAAAVWYWNEHRHAGLLDSLNPAYWVRRMRGEELAIRALVRIGREDRDVGDLRQERGAGAHVLSYPTSAERVERA